MDSNKFVDLIALSQESCPHPIQGLLAYATRDNFLGRVVQGYSPESRRLCLLTKRPANQLCRVQNALNKKGLGLFIFDAFRPLRAVRDFCVWASAPIISNHEKRRKELHFPHLEKKDLEPLGYLSQEVSEHCFGHAVDLSLVDLTTNVLLNMGTIFDYFGVLSHHPEASSELIGQEAFENRELLAKTMSEFGFVAYPKEYWHFAHEEQELDAPADFDLR